MKNVRLFYFAPYVLSSLMLLGCSRSSYDVWEDTKTCGRHINRGLCCLGGGPTRSRAVCSPDEFYYEDVYDDSNGEDFVPLMDNSRPVGMNMNERPVPPQGKLPEKQEVRFQGLNLFPTPA